MPESWWNDWWAIGGRRNSHHADRPSSEYVHPEAHKIGIIGEAFFGWMVGQEAATDVNAIAGDDGTDFPNLDVKTADYLPRPWLKVRADKVAKAPSGRLYALVAVNARTRQVRYCGYVTRENLLTLKPTQIRLRSDRSSDRTGLQRSENLGPSSYVIENEFSLTRTLPPGFTLNPKFLTGP